MNAKTRIRKKVLSLHGLHGLHSLHGLQSAVCSLHGLRFGVTDKNVTKAHKKADQNVPDVITSVDKKVAERLGLDNRIEVSANRDLFIAMKDHKPGFMNNPTCRLVNPSKSEIGIMSKQIL